MMLTVLTCHEDHLGPIDSYKLFILMTIFPMLRILATSLSPARAFEDVEERDMIEGKNFMKVRLHIRGGIFTGKQCSHLH